MEYGRIRIIKKLASEFNGFSLNIGSKETMFGDINTDIDVMVAPDIVTDICHSPFKSGTFDIIYFTDVVGYLPKNNEAVAIKEINRMLKNDGVMIFTAPNDRTIFTILNIEIYVMKYRHHRKEYVENLIKKCGFDIEKIFIAGSYWECIAYLWYCLITFPIKKIFRMQLSYAPSLLMKLSDKGYSEKSDNGYTIFCIGRKK